MKVAGIQMDIAWEDPKENFQRARRLAEEAVRDGARMVVLPEMFATGFSMDAERVSGYAEKTREFLSRLATELGVFVLAGYAEPGNPKPAKPKPANVCSLFDSAGTELLHYRKIHPFSLAGEDEHFLAGESVATAEVEGIRVTPFICYDLRFPEPFRAVAADTTSSAFWRTGRRPAGNTGPDSWRPGPSRTRPIFSGSIEWALEMAWTTPGTQPSWIPWGRRWPRSFPVCRASSRLMWTPGRWPEPVSGSDS